MKFNLKNRPKLMKTILGYSYSDVCKFEKWFEGFEKELREKLKSYQDLVKFSSSGNYFNQFTDVAYQVAIELIKEILGENDEG